MVFQKDLIIEQLKPSTTTRMGPSSSSSTGRRRRPKRGTVWTTKRQDYRALLSFVAVLLLVLMLMLPVTALSDDKTKQPPQQQHGGGETTSKMESFLFRSTLDEELEDAPQPTILTLRGGGGSNDGNNDDNDKQEEEDDEESWRTNPGMESKDATPEHTDDTHTPLGLLSHGHDNLNDEPTTPSSLTRLPLLGWWSTFWSHRTEWHTASLLEFSNGTTHRGGAFVPPPLRESTAPPSSSSPASFWNRWMPRPFRLHPAMTTSRENPMTTTTTEPTTTTTHSLEKDTTQDPGGSSSVVSWKQVWWNHAWLDHIPTTSSSRRGTVPPQLVAVVDDHPGWDEPSVPDETTPPSNTSSSTTSTTLEDTSPNDEKPNGVRVQKDDDDDNDDSDHVLLLSKEAVISPPEVTTVEEEDDDDKHHHEKNQALRAKPGELWEFHPDNNNNDKETPERSLNTINDNVLVRLEPPNDPETATSQTDSSKKPMAADIRRSIPDGESTTLPSPQQTHSKPKTKTASSSSKKKKKKKKTTSAVPTTASTQPAVHDTASTTTVLTQPDTNDDDDADDRPLVEEEPTVSMEPTFVDPASSSTETPTSDTSTVTSSSVLSAPDTPTTTHTVQVRMTPYTSSGAWMWVDALLAPGPIQHYLWKPSIALRPLRKTMAHWTGLHGVLSGKPPHGRGPPLESTVSSSSLTLTTTTTNDDNKDGEELVLVTAPTTTTPEQRRLQAIARARETVARVEEEERLQQERRRPRWTAWLRPSRSTRDRTTIGLDEVQFAEDNEDDTSKQTSQTEGSETMDAEISKRPEKDRTNLDTTASQAHESADNNLQETKQQWDEEQEKQARLKEIDRLMAQKSQQMADLATEKDLILNLLHPLWNYTTASTYHELSTARHEATEQEASSSSAATSASSSSLFESITPKREFNFPSDDLVEEYISVLVHSERLVKMNHTDLWRNGDLVETNSDDLDDELDDDDEWLSLEERRRRRARTNGGPQPLPSSQPLYRNGDGGSRWLRIQGLGEKLGQTIEDLAYKAICFQVMAGLARGVAGGLHGINILGHADIGIKAEQPPIMSGPSSAHSGHASTGLYSNADSYARQAFENAISKQQPSSSSSSSNSRKQKKHKLPTMTAAESVQRYAVVETLLSQCQVAMPLLKLFPLVWQRALIGNLVTVITAVIGDFLQGLEFQLLGYKLELALKPITEEDVMKRLQQSSQYHSQPSSSSSYNNGGSGDYRWSHQGASYSYDPRDNHHPHGTDDENDFARSQQAFEAAVQATATDLAESLKFLDKWHERVFLGGDSIRLQVATLIARVVLSLVDDILSDARIDLWSSSSLTMALGGGGKASSSHATSRHASPTNWHMMATMLAGGPTLKAGLYYRTPYHNQRSSTNTARSTSSSSSTAGGQRT